MGTSILTDNKIKINNVFKGNVIDSIITVTTFGGEVENSLQFQLQTIQLGISQKGYLFLRKNQKNKYDFVNKGFAKINNDLSPKVISNGQGYFVFEFENEITFHTKLPKQNFDEHLNWLALKQANSLDTCIFLPANKKDGNKIEFSFKNPRLSNDLQYLEFDIFAEVNTPGLRFGKANLHIKYTEEFGSNIIRNNTITVEKGEIIKSDLYTMKIADAESQSFRASIEAGSSYFDFYPLTVKPQSLLKVKIKRSLLSSLGKISFDDFAIDGQVYYMCYGEYYKFDNIVFDNPLNHIIPQPDDPIGAININYSLQNQQYLESVGVYYVEVFAETTQLSDFSEGTVCIDYNTLAFGNNVISNSKAVFVTSSFLNNYTVNVQDMASNTILIHLANNSGPYSSLTNQPAYLGRLYFSKVSCDYTKDITFNPIMLSENHLHYNGTFNIAYNDVVANDQLTGLICGCDAGPPQITSFTPSEIPAGNGDILTIKGFNFGTFNSNTSKVEFKNGDDGGNFNSTMNAHPQDFIIAPNVLGWTDTEIKLKVPSVGATALTSEPACSGKFKVINGCGMGESLMPLKIPYAVTNIRRGGNKALKIAIKEQGNDGLCFSFSSQIPPWVKTQFENALNDWCNQTGINFYISQNDVPNNTASATDGINLISNEATPAGSPASTIFSSDALRNCTGGGEDGVFIIDIDIKINPAYANVLNPTNAEIIKLRNYLRHELGHAHMINHSVMLDFNGNPITADQQYITYYTFNNTINNITIKADDREGAEQVFNNSQQVLLGGVDNNGNSCGSPIQYGLCGTYCNTIIDNIATYNTLNGIFEVWQENSNSFGFKTDEINLTDAELIIVDCTGKTRHQYIYKNLTSKESLPVNLNTGIYYVNLRTPKGYLTQKILFQ